MNFFRFLMRWKSCHCSKIWVDELCFCIVFRLLPFSPMLRYWRTLDHYLVTSIDGRKVAAVTEAIPMQRRAYAGKTSQDRTLETNA